MRNAGIWMAAAVVGMTACSESNPRGEKDGGPIGVDTSTDTGDQFKGCTTDDECVVALPDLTDCQVAVCDAVSQNCKPMPRENGATCDDGDPCTGASTCKDGGCTGTPKDCDDDNPCTNDFCDPATGECTGQPNAALCDDGNFCTEDDQCSNGVCSGTANPTCDCQTNEDCAQYDDADLCNGVLMCTNSECVPKPGSEVTCPDTGNPCRISECSPTNGECKNAPVAEGTACSDQDSCTGNDVCVAGVCEGTPAQCDDNNGCTDDSCDPATGCVHASNTEPCDDGDLCTVDDACADGGCAGTKNPDCDCLENADCNTFEDGDLCNGTLVCDGGACVVDAATIVDCTAEVAPECTVVTCEATSGDCVSKPALNGTQCTDGSSCSENDHCEGGECVGAAVVCDDDNPCTNDGCDDADGCSFTPNEGADCDDENDCTNGDVCTAEGVCAGEGDCDCTEAADCAIFEDDDLCNGTLECNAGSCEVSPGTVIECLTGVGTCTPEICVPATGECLPKELPNGDECDDGDACTESDFCSDGLCEGKPISCDDGTICTDDSCDISIGCVYEFSDAECDDGNPCTINDDCTQGTCGGTSIADCSCETDADCVEFDDADACNGVLVCAAAKCVVESGSEVVCPPSDLACQTNACQPDTGECVLTDAGDGKPCDDGDACTLDDFCLIGECLSDMLLACDDGNDCTDDLCTPEFGCISEPADGTECDDGDPCTVGDVCDLGLCQPGAENVCGDSCQAARSIGCGEFDTYDTALIGSTKVVTDYSCSSDSFPGGEYTYLFSAPFAANVTVTLSNEDTITDIHVLSQTDIGCDPQACVATGYSSATFEAAEGETLYLVVDGYLDEEGGYTVTIDCTPTTETDCTDGIDDDDDGATDCDDDDCALDEACLPPQCVADWDLSCGSSDTWGNYYPGSTDVLSSYDGCGNPWSYYGPEYTYTFVAPASGEVTLTLSDESASTDVIVLQAGEGDTCQADACIAYGLSSATFDAVEGQTYYIVVDGFFFAEGTYGITVECEDDAVVVPQTETACDDGVDEDEDGVTDCEDADCFGVSDACQPACVPDDAFPATLGCPSATDSWNNGSFGSNDLVTSYGCAPSLEYSAPEYVYTYMAELDGPVTVTLSNEANPDDTDLILLEDKGLGCNPASCLDWALEELTFDAVAGTTYYIAVDATDDAEGDYDLAFSCGE